MLTRLTFAALAVWVCGFVFHLDWLLDVPLSKGTKDKQIAEAEYVQHHMEDHVPPPPKPKKK